MQRLVAEVKFVCPLCHEEATSSAYVPEPHWGAFEKMSELTSEDQTDVECNICNTGFPAYVFNSASGCEVTLDEYPDTLISTQNTFFSPSDPDDWLNNEIPDNPYQIFMDSHFHMGDIHHEYKIGAVGAYPHRKHIINRMVFTQQISALEAYLGDTLIRRISQDSKALKNLLMKDDELNKAKFTLADVQANPNFVKEFAQKYLQGILYHNLAKVNFFIKLHLESIS